MSQHATRRRTRRRRLFYITDTEIVVARWPGRAGHKSMEETMTGKKLGSRRGVNKARRRAREGKGRGNAPVTNHAWRVIVEEQARIDGREQLVKK